MSRIEDFKDAACWTIETTLRERYGEQVEFQLADSDIPAAPHRPGASECPLVYRERDGCHFIIVKTGDRRYRCQFYYRLHQQYGTGVDEYGDLGECTVSLLQAQTDHSRERARQQERQRQIEPVS